MGRVDILIEQLHDGDHTRRTYATYELIATGEPALDALSDALQDTDADIRARAAFALGEVGDTRAVEPLSQTLADDERHVREAAVKALVKIGGEDVVEPLLRALIDRDSQVRIVAATALAATGDERTFEPLISMTSDFDMDVRIAAAKMLGKVAAMPVVDALWRARITDAVARCLEDRSESVRRSAVCVLGEIGGERVFLPLLGALKDEDVTVRAATALVLGELKDPIALPGLLARLNVVTGEHVKAVQDCIAEAVDSIQRAMASMPIDD